MKETQEKWKSKRKVKNCKKVKKEQGITLIALVITIVILLILAGITINFIFSEGGIFNTAQKAKEENRIGEIMDQFYMAEAYVSMDKLGKPTMEDFIKYIQDEEIIVEAEKQNEEGDIYLVITEDGYAFEVTWVPGNNVNDIIIEYEGKKDNLPAKIRKVEIVEETVSSVTIEVTTVRADNTTLKYYYKLKNELEYQEVDSTKSNNICEINNLNRFEVYNLKVELIQNEQIIDTKEIEIIVGDLQEGDLTFGEVVWENGKASIPVLTTTELQIQYKINEGEWNNIGNGENITNIANNSDVHAKLVIGNNSSKEIHTKIEDKIDPLKAEYLISKDNKIEITLLDKESGIDIGKCKWVYNKTKEPIGTDASLYTGGTFKTNPQTLDFYVGEYLHILTVDYSGNKTETIINKTYLYNKGNQCEEITGGWITQFLQGTLEFRDEEIYVETVPQWGGTWLTTKNEIDYSKYSKFCYTIDSNAVDEGKFIVNRVIIMPESYTDDQTILQSHEAGNNLTYEIDLTNITIPERNKIGFAIQNQSTIVKIHEVWLEL